MATIGTDSPAKFITDTVVINGPHVRGQVANFTFNTRKNIVKGPPFMYSIAKEQVHVVSG